MLLRTQGHTRRSRRPRPSQHRSTHTAPFSLRKSSHVAPTALGPLGFAARTQRLFLVQGSHPLFGRPFLLANRSALRHARIQARTHARARMIRSLLAAHCTTPADTHARAHAHTRAHGPPTTNDATCGPPAWLTGSLHEGGVRSVSSQLRWPPLLATPIATPL